MKWIDSTDIQTWATRRDCQETMPLLIRKLIRASTDKINNIKFPAGESVLLGGWDGILEVQEATEYIPNGISLWEIGASKEPKGKADSDYDKRTKNPLGYIPSDSTFIFVTPRLWLNGEEWAKKKLSEGIWKDVIVLNSETLEEWIETVPTVGAWLAKQIGKYPDGGIQPTDDFWEEWSSGGKFNLNPDILLGGRSLQVEQTRNAVLNPAIIAVQGISREEALAFVVSCFKEDQDLEETFFARSVIVDNVDAFRELSVLTTPLILIPRFEDMSVINRAQAKGHTVIVPVDTYNGANWTNKIILPPIDRDSFVAGLQKAGMSKEFAERYSKETARNITILRRQLEFERTLPEWASPENVADLVPALIVGRWDETFEEDKSVVAEIAGIPYENYIKKLSRWQYVADAPIVRLGNSWRLTAPFDAWINASINLTRSDFDLLRKVSHQILLEINPAFDLEPEQRYMASVFGKKRSFSTWIREGILQSLILTSIFGDRLRFNLPVSGELWVDRIIDELLITENPETWRSFEGLLPLISEASPTSFLSNIERHMREDKPAIPGLFVEDPGFLTSNSYHTGLLWALEGLAWFPRYFSRVIVILARLSEIDPGGQMSNRPINSLGEILNPWRYQTLATFEERMDVLKLISQKEPNVGWKVLLTMLPGGRDIAHPTHTTRWRNFDHVTEREFTYKELFDTYSSVVDILIEMFDFSESKFSELIDQSTQLPPAERNRLLIFLTNSIPRINQVEHTGWHALRSILSRHRSYADTDWAMDVETLDTYQALYDRLAPIDDISNLIWMFDQTELEFPEGFDEVNGNFNEKIEQDLQRRIEVLSKLYAAHTIGKIILLSREVKEPWVMGDTLGYLNISQDDQSLLWSLLEKKEDLNFIRSFIFRFHLRHGFDISQAIYANLKQQNYSEEALTNFLLSLRVDQKIWDLVEQQNENIRDSYWKQLSIFGQSTEEKIFGIEKLILYKRFVSAIHQAALYTSELPTSVIIELLEKAGTEESVETGLRGYSLHRLFETLDKREGVSEDTLFRLEWLFLPMLASFNSRRKPKSIHKELSRNPVFFMEVLSLIYKPVDESKLDEIRTKYSNEQLLDRAKRARELLESWKTIPGTDENGEIDFKFLNEWINSLRKEGEVFGRAQVADRYIGRILAQYPEKEGEIWPADGICEIIERLNSDDINGNFSAGIFNKGGWSSRAVFEGGNIERKKAEYFNKLANAHRNRFLVISEIFERLEKSYLAEARRQDEDAEKDRLDY